nr:hypothetical protein BaRGS_009549 [Batillaria attramentaria]
MCYGPDGEAVAAQPRFTHFTGVPPDKKTEVKLILLTYMRSGSTFAGDLFNQHPDVFYVFEPLRPIQNQIIRKHTGAIFLDLNPVWQNADKQEKSLQTQVTKAYLDCRFGALNLRAFYDASFLSVGKKTKPFIDCRRNHQGIMGILGCLPLLQHPCAAARVTSLKTIRLSMEQAASLAKSDPKVKVVHLVRDPRGTLRSQRIYGKFKPSETDQFSKTFCKRVLQDAQVADKLTATYPGRVLRVRYEDLASEPLNFAEKMLGFAGLTLNDGLRGYIWNITMAGNTSRGVLRNERSNSTETSMEWRLKFDFNSTSTIDNNCREVYQRFGYLPLKTKRDLVDLGVPSVLGYAKVHGLW